MPCWRPVRRRPNQPGFRSPRPPHRGSRPRRRGRAALRLSPRRWSPTQRRP
jgi:hypothetical protein